MKYSFPYSPELIAEKISGAGRRILLFGESGIGKSTLAAQLAQILAQDNRPCLCIGADPGSPSFGIPGAVCLGEWKNDAWQLVKLEALCTLNSGRFRLPLVSAVRRLASDSEQKTVLVDAPGIVRNVAGAELLTGLAEAVKADTVLVLVRDDKKLPLQNELTTTGCEIFIIPPSPQAHLPSKKKRALQRTRLWDEYLCDAVQQTIQITNTQLTGTPPPMVAEMAWQGRQIALINKGATIAMGEVKSIHQGNLQLRIGEIRIPPDQILVRDACRNEKGLLVTSKPLNIVTLRGMPPPDVRPYSSTERISGPAPIVRCGEATGVLVNGVLGDPLLHMRFHNSRRSILFDIGEGNRLPARLAHQVSDVFVSHAHFDHISGFLWLLRSRIGIKNICRFYGPSGLSDHILNMMNGIKWDRIGENGPRFEIGEFFDDQLLVFRIQAGHKKKKTIGKQHITNGLVLKNTDCAVRAVILQHGSIPVIAYSLEMAAKLNVRKEALLERNIPSGPWLGTLKKLATAGDRNVTISLPDNTTATVGRLADDLLQVTPAQKLVYATDLSDTEKNREKLITLAQGANTLFCEAGFIEKDKRYAEMSGHLTAFNCGEIARTAEVDQLVPFHFSRRYETKYQVVYDEIKEKWSGILIGGYA